MSTASGAPNNTGDMRGKICLITGSTSGIGKVTALELAGLGATVVVVARDRGRGETTVAEIKAQSGRANVALLLADLSSQASIRTLAEQVLASYPQLHVLINNAGALFTTRAETIDGIETTWATNHLAYFLLTNLLLERLKASGTATDPARIVNVASEASRTGKINFDDLQGQTSYRGFAAYSQSKLANIMFTYELAERLRDSPVTANCLHPGVIASGFGRNNQGLVGTLARLFAPLMTTPEAGARTSIYLASSPEVTTISGKYFNKRRPIRSNSASYDPAARRRLWQISAEMTHLTDS